MLHVNPSASDVLVHWCVRLLQPWARHVGSSKEHWTQREYLAKYSIQYYVTPKQYYSIGAWIEQHRIKILSPERPVLTLQKHPKFNTVSPQ